MNTAAAREYWEGQTVDGKFPLFERLCDSESSAVFLTQLPGLSPEKAAIKLIPADPKDSEQLSLRWRESAALSHPNLLRIFEMGKCRMGGAWQQYIVMEYADENLAQVLPHRPLSLAEIGELLPPMIDALSYLHSQGLVHGRVKPSNIVAVGNQLKLSTDSIYLSGPAVRPLPPTAYDAPEVAEHGPSKASDIWSLGMTLVAASTQRPITWNKSAQRELAVPNSIPEPYRQITRACLRINPGERCTLSEIRESLTRGVPVQALDSGPDIPPPPQAGKRKVGWPFLALGALIVVILGVMLTRHRAGSPPPLTPNGEVRPSNTVVSPPPSADSNSTAAASTESAPGAVAERVLPEVAASARRTITGKVRVKVLVSVSPDGQVSSATFASPGPSKYFARLALEASQRWRFKPAEAAGQRVASQWLLEYRFGRASTEVIPVEQQPKP